MAVPTYTNPDYNPNTWKLGYLIGQYGQFTDPSPSGTTSGFPPSAYSTMANPPASMTTALLLAIPTAPGITPDQ